MERLKIENGNDLLQNLQDIVYEGMSQYVNEILTKYSNHLKWEDLSNRHQMDILNCLNFSKICTNYELSNDFIYDFRLHINFKVLLRHQKLEQDIIKEYLPCFNPLTVICYQDLSDEEIKFIENRYDTYFSTNDDSLSEFCETLSQKVLNNPKFNIDKHFSAFLSYEIKKNTSITKEELIKFIDNLTDDKMKNRELLSKFLSSHLLDNDQIILINNLNELKAQIAILTDIEETHLSNDVLELLNTLNKYDNFKDYEFSYDFIKENPMCLAFYAWSKTVPEELLLNLNNDVLEEINYSNNILKTFKFSEETLNQKNDMPINEFLNDEYHLFVHQYLKDEYILANYRELFDEAVLLSVSDNDYQESSKPYGYEFDNAFSDYFSVPAARILRFTHLSQEVLEDIKNYINTSVAIRHPDFNVEHIGIALSTRYDVVPEDYCNISTPIDIKKLQQCYYKAREELIGELTKLDKRPYINLLDEEEYQDEYNEIVDMSFEKFYGGILRDILKNTPEMFTDDERKKIEKILSQPYKYHENKADLSLDSSKDKKEIKYDDISL